MLPGMNSKKAAQMMKKMGIQQVEVPAIEVTIRTPDSILVFTNPQVSKVNMMGQSTFQVVGEPEERPISDKPEINKDDILTVAEGAGVSEEQAKLAIEEANGDLAEAIMNLKKNV